jgi:DNA primase
MFPPHVQKWFQGRGLTQKTLDKFNVSWNGSQIVIPIKNNEGKVLFNKFRRDPAVDNGPKYQNEKGSTAFLFNFDPSWNEVVICEGELDAMLLSQYGINATSCTCGAGTFPKTWGPIFEGKKVYLCLDNDPAGYKGTIRIASILREAEVIPFPRHSTVKDVTDFIRQHGIKKFQELKNNAYHLALPADSLEEIKKELLYCTHLRRSLYSKDLSAGVVEEYITGLNDRKALHLRRNKKIKISNDIAALKQVPIDKFLQFNYQGFASCIFHNEKTPSLKYYPDTNSVYCFSCQAYGDVITIVRALNKCTFEEAISILKKA